ncbi:MAG: UDP-N-acetylglucosamine--N-acetylmuramyl-(pentapeptide) pyrophosphoryl-undecaprenol N-acetylglucosamine transferase, partial [Pseudomonadales bacterium]|nr:UDP-N-acetylglucosamine--N-acetylmuramyl-(pentapeptide) pyrophosphoryl-undecaprenol N-acetylglucosamine transferase [Pseudomonadales bacterium]
MNNEQKQNILISGGHLTPAVAFIDYSIVENFGFKFFFAGRKYAQKKTRQLSHEEQAMAERGVDFINFDSVNADNFEWRELRKAVKQARKIIKENDINLFLSFGGYLAVPFAIAAWLEKVPVITHEQTQVLGKANKLVALFANKVAMSSPTTKTIFANKKVVTGNPLRPKLFQKSGEPPIWFKNFDSKLPYLYISGGSQGSKAINENVAEVLSELTKNFVVIHQIGATSKVRDPALEVAKILEKHSPIQKQNYFSRPYLSEVELSFLYPKISIALARAGAN